MSASSLARSATPRQDRRSFLTALAAAPALRVVAPDTPAPAVVGSPPQQKPVRMRLWKGGFENGRDFSIVASSEAAVRARHKQEEDTLGRSRLGGPLGVEAVGVEFAGNCVSVEFCFYPQDWRPTTLFDLPPSSDYFRRVATNWFDSAPYLTREGAISEAVETNLETLAALDEWEAGDRNRGLAWWWAVPVEISQSLDGHEMRFSLDDDKFGVVQIEQVAAFRVLQPTIAERRRFSALAKGGAA